MPVPEQEDEQDEERQRVGQQVGRAGMEQRAERDPDETGNRSRHDAESRQRAVPCVLKNQVGELHDEERGNHQGAGLHRFFERFEVRSGHAQLFRQ